MEEIKGIEKFFELKANISSIAEKAKNNLEKKQKSKTKDLHYFAIRHTFKNIDKEIFKYQENSQDTSKKNATPFTRLQKENFSKIENKLIEYIESIRNINAHFIHDFSKMKIEDDGDFKKFVFGAFKFAVYNSYAKLNELAIKDINQHNTNIVEWLKNNFFPWNDKSVNEEDVKNTKHKSWKYKQLPEAFGEKELEQALEYILFINLQEAIHVGVENQNFKISADQQNYQHTFFSIEEGTYLSAEACLFLLSLFLYKNEANTLISKIQGFKRNDKDKYKSKRNIFTFFSKKFSSEDIDSEQAHLVKFRDIIQYLNKFPVTWNAVLDQENHELKKVLETKIFDLSTDRIDKIFFQSIEKHKDYKNILENSKDKKKFFKFLIENLKSCGDYKKLLVRNARGKLEENNKKFLDLIKQPQKLKIQDLEDKKKTSKKSEQENIQTEIEKHNAQNFAVEKYLELKNRIFNIYARNQDRFILFALRFLAEKNYFGTCVQFKMYRFFDMEQQEEYVKSLDEKTKDKLNYHDGRITHFSTFSEHLKKYPTWDTPFVVQNNAVQIKVDGRTIGLQRDLLPYFLEDCFNLKNGRELLANYFEKYDKDSFNLRNQPVTEENKNQFRQLFPKRLAACLITDYKKGETKNPLKELLQKTEAYDKWYKKRKKRAKQENDPHFEKRNKGKRFKWMFVFRAWNYMFFKEIYKQELSTKDNGKHHKSYHISRDKFNELSRNIYNWGDDTIHGTKEELEKILQKFFSNEKFKTLFNSCKNLDEAYGKTKERFKEFIETFELKRNLKSFDSYLHLKEKGKDRQKHIYYINLSYFRDFLKEKETNFFTKAKQNYQHLLWEFYGRKYEKDKISKEDSKNKILKKLYHIRLEDAYLYEIAMDYLQNQILTEQVSAEHSKKNVSDFLQQDVEFDITDKTQSDKKLYKLKVPFKHLPSLVELIEHKKNQEDDQKNSKTSYLRNIDQFIQIAKDQKDIKNIHKEYNIINNKLLTYDQLKKIDSYILTTSNTFSSFILLLEKHFVVKYKISIPTNKNYIEYENIKLLKNYFCSRFRNKVAHFGLPQKKEELYLIKLKECEKIFIKEEITKPINSWSDLQPETVKEVCTVFLEKLHNDYFEHPPKNQKNDDKKSKEEQRRKVQEKYIKNHVQNTSQKISSTP